MTDPLVPQSLLGYQSKVQSRTRCDETGILGDTGSVSLGEELAHGSVSQGKSCPVLGISMRAEGGQ